MEAGDKAGRAVLATVHSGGGCRGVNVDLLTLLCICKSSLKKKKLCMRLEIHVALLENFLPSTHKALGSIPSTA